MTATRHRLLDDDTITVGGKTLYRLEAVCDIPEHGIVAGTRGGYVSKEAIFPQDSRAWIHPDARVIGGTFHGGDFYGGYFRSGNFHGGDFYDGYFYGGTFHGGTFHGGDFYGGTFHGGDFYGGTFRGGTFHGGNFHGGVFHGGVFHGGNFHGGYFHGGVFHGGVFHGGNFHGGYFHGGEWRSSPFQAQGPRHFINVADGEGRVQIGCHRKHIDEWLQCYEAVGRHEGYTATEIAIYKALLDACKIAIDGMKEKRDEQR